MTSIRITRSGRTNGFSYVRIAKTKHLQVLFNNNITSLIESFLTPWDLPTVISPKISEYVECEEDYEEEEEFDWDEFNDYYPIEYYDYHDTYEECNIYRTVCTCDLYPCQLKGFHYEDECGCECEYDCYSDIDELDEFDDDWYLDWLGGGYDSI